MRKELRLVGVIITTVVIDGILVSNENWIVSRIFSIFLLNIMG